MAKVVDAPRNVVTIVTGTVVTVIVSIVGALTALGIDTTDFNRILQTLLNFGGLVLGTVSAIYAGTAAKKSGETATRLNGQLDSRIEDAVHKVLTERDDDGRPGI